MSTTSSVPDGKLESQPIARKAEEGSVDLDKGSSSTSSSLVIVDETGSKTEIMQSKEASSTVPHVSINMDSDDAKLQQADISRIIKEKDFGSLQNIGGVQQIADALNTDLEYGLSSDEARQAGTITLIQIPTPGFFVRLLKACNDYTVWLLLLDAALSLFFGIEGMADALRDGCVPIAVTILIVAQNYLELHLAKMSGQRELSDMPLKVLVKRGGHEMEVCISNVVIGDIVLLERGCLVPADGLFFKFGEFSNLVLDDESTIDANQPFLFFGAKVTRGSGGMIVTSVGSGTTLGDLMTQVTQEPGANPLSAELDKINIVLQVIGLLIPILILLVLFLRWKVGNEDVHPKMAQIKGKPGPITEAIKGIFMKTNGKFGALIATLTMSLLGVKGGIPYVITRYIDYWWKKMLSNKASAQEPLAWLNMASVSTICIDEAAWLRLKRQAADMEALRNAGVNLILIFKDKAPGLEALGFDSNGLVITGERFRNYSNEERMEAVDNIIVMEGCSPSDKLLLMQCLKKKGKRVAMIGGKTNEIPVLKEADVGILMEAYSSEMARESSDIIIRDDHFSFLLTIVLSGRCTYKNIQKYIQFELAMTIAGLLIPTITTISFGYSPMSVIQMLWANTIVTFLGGLALMTEPPTKNLMNKPPKSQTEPFITKAMWRNIVSQALSQTAILVFFQSEGHAILGISKEVSESIIFNTFVLFQVFNIIIAREPENENVFRGIHRNPWLRVAVASIMVLQVAFIEVTHTLTGSENLSWEQWLVCLLNGTILLATDWATKCSARCVLDDGPGPFGSHMGAVGRTPFVPSASASNLEMQLVNGNPGMSSVRGIPGNNNV